MNNNMGPADKEFQINISSPEEGFGKRPSQITQIRYAFREYCAEFLGTVLLIVFGVGVVAQVTFNPAAKGSSFLSINLGWAFGLTCAIFVSGPVSGGHLNPAVTISNAITRRFPWRKVPGYIIAQVSGAFVGAALVYCMYWPAFNAFDNGVRSVVGDTATGGVFFTIPFNGAPIYSSFITEFINTAILMICILGINDPRHKVPSYMGALFVGLVVGTIGMCIGMMTGYAMNPARDLGPRLFTLAAGWGMDAFTNTGYYFWVPIVAPICGALFGILAYDMLIYPQENVI